MNGYDLLAATSTTGRVSPPALHPVAGFHRMVWHGDGWGRWLGVPPEPGNVLVLDVGAADMLTEDGYREACRIAGHWPSVVVTGTGEAVASVISCLEQYRAKLEAA